MKTLILTLLTSLLALTSVANAQEGYKVRAIRPQFVFAPKGYDSNDNAQLVLYGVFSDVCHKILRPKVSIDRASNKIQVQLMASVREMCVDMYVQIPYTTTVDLGTLNPGRYDISVKSDDGTRYVDTLPIHSPKVATSIDDGYYERIDRAPVEFNAGMSYPEVTLYGVIPNTCLTLREVKVVTGPGNVVDILPLLQRTRTTNCQPTNIPFVQKIQLHIPLNVPTLLNIRSAGGQAILQVFDPRESIFSHWKP